MEAQSGKKKKIFEDSWRVLGESLLKGTWMEIPRKLLAGIGARIGSGNGWYCHTRPVAIPSYRLG
ncbi:unnamed protein product [Prunus armeniaca]